MCTDVTHKDFIAVHHELAHVQYFLNYRNLPKTFRDGANPGFHDAIGDAISLSITPKHLQGLGLIQKSVEDTAHEINFLFSMAMDKVSDDIKTVNVFSTLITDSANNNLFPGGVSPICVGSRAVEIRCLKQESSKRAI